MKTTNFKKGDLCFWSGNQSGFVIILGDCKSFDDSYSAFDLNSMSSVDISLSESNLRLATLKEKRSIIQKLK